MTNTTRMTPELIQRRILDLKVEIRDLNNRRFAGVTHTWHGLRVGERLEAAYWRLALLESQRAA